MNDPTAEAAVEPVSQPAHMVTTQVDPVVSVTREATSHELAEQLNGLLRMKIVVEPVIHHEDVPELGIPPPRPHRNGQQRARRRRELPVTEWEVVPFEGGRISWLQQSEAGRCANMINDAIVTAIRPLMEALIVRAKALATTESIALEQGKVLSNLLWEIGQMKEFQVTASGYAVIPRRCAFRMTDKLKAEQFAAAVNEVIRKLTYSSITDLQAALVCRLNAL